MYCMKCGAPNTPEGRFCIRCGATLEITVSPPAGEAAGAERRGDQEQPGGGQAPAADVEALLEQMYARLGHTRLEAIETISRMPESDLRIVKALIETSEGGWSVEIRSAAAEALCAPAHQAILQRHPNLAARALAVTSRSSSKPQPSPPTGSTPPAAALPSAGASSAPSSYASSGYAALRGMASLFNLIGAGFVVLGGLGAIGGLMAMADELLVGLTVFVASVFWGGLGYVSMRVVAESISVLLDIEANTRRAANLLEQRLK